MSPDLRQNLEIKARCPDLASARKRLVDAGAVPHELLDQVDTYFHVSRGRLKLRQIRGRIAQLIGYDRADQSGPRHSSFRIVEIPNPEALLSLLGNALSIRIEVRKDREVLLWENVRIHLDEVDGLGTFIELEAVISSTVDEHDSPARLAHLCNLLHITPEETIGESYADLLRSDPSSFPLALTLS